MLLPPFQLHTPKTLKSALELYSSLSHVRLQAGGTFLFNNLKLLKKKGMKTPENILSLSRIHELHGIHSEGEKITIQAMTTIAEILESPLLGDHRLKTLRTVCRNISTQPVKNMATLGGNLTCRYTWTEMPVAMIALQAQMHFVGADGNEEVIPAENFFADTAKTDKILTHVTIKKAKDAAVTYFRVKKSPYLDIPLLSICIKTNWKRNQFTETIVAVNNGTAFAQRDRLLEGFLNQQPCSEKIIEQAADHMDRTIYEIRSSDYKKHMFRVGIKTALKELIADQK